MQNSFISQLFLSLSALVLCACATDQSASQSTVEYGCDDVVLLGRVVSSSYSDDIPADERCIYTSDGECIEWRGRYDLEIWVKRVLKGDESRSVVPASAIAHAQIRDDVDFAFVLIPMNDGYGIRSAYISDARSKTVLADSCFSAS